jgi:hypothetical protein
MLLQVPVSRVCGDQASKSPEIENTPLHRKSVLGEWEVGRVLVFNIELSVVV